MRSKGTPLYFIRGADRVSGHRLWDSSPLWCSEDTDSQGYRRHNGLVPANKRVSPGNIPVSAEQLFFGKNAG